MIGQLRSFLCLLFSCSIILSSGSRTLLDDHHPIRHRKHRLTSPVKHPRQLSNRSLFIEQLYNENLNCFPANSFFANSTPLTVLPDKESTFPKGLLCSYPLYSILHNQEADEHIYYAHWVPDTFISPTSIEHLMYVVNPYLPDDSACHYVLETSYWAQARCEMPSRCGQIMVTEISSSFWGKMVYLCHGSQALLPVLSNGTITLAGSNIVQIFTHKSFLLWDWPDLANKILVMYDGRHYSFIPSGVVQSGVRYNEEQITFEVFGPEAPCLYKYPQSLLTTQLAPFPIGEQLTTQMILNSQRITVQLLDYKYPIPWATMILKGVDDVPRFFEYRTYARRNLDGVCIGEGPTALPYQCEPLLTQACIHPRLNVRYDVPLLTTLMHHIVIACQEFVMYVLSAFALLIRSFLSPLIDLGLVEHSLMYTILYAHYRSVYLSLALTLLIKTFLSLIGH